MGADNSKEERPNYREEKHRRAQYVTQLPQQSRVTRPEQAPTHYATYQSPTQTPTERSRTPYSYTPESSQSVIKQGSQPNVLERSRNPYNFNSEELHGNKQPPNLYPNLNRSPEDSFVHVNYGQPRFSQQPSAPPASEVNVGSSVPSSPKHQFSTAAVVQKVQTSHVNAGAVPKALSRPLQPSVLSHNVPGSSQSVDISANKNITSPNASGPSKSVNTPANKNGPNSGGRGRDHDFSCPTCGQRYGITIFQCANGHGCCKDCRLAQRSCGKCLSHITDMRNIALESVVADLSDTCQNQGCTLRFKFDEMERHLKECPFGEMDCPIGTVFGRCPIRCKVADLAAHFDECHKEQREAEIGKEMFVFNICMETHKMFLVKNGPYTFLVHIQVEESDRKVSMTVQLLGTKISAEKWTYEFHVYNKRQPLRKYLFVDSCQSIGTPVKDIFKENQCAVLPLSYAMTFVNESALTYKFYIKKEMNQRKGRPRNKNAN